MLLDAVRLREKMTDIWIRKPIWALLNDNKIGLTHHNSEIDNCNEDSSSDGAYDRDSGHKSDNGYGSCLTSATSASSLRDSSPLLHFDIVGNEPKELHRHLSLFDLVCVGVGATIGSGIYVLCGLIANKYAGPATFLSWGIAGGAACFSGVCYAELAGKLPSAGSVYVYAYVSIGELPAVLAAACLTLEYVGSAAAVARSWGDKIIEWAHEESSPLERYLDPGFGFNPMAFLVSFCSTLLLLKGVKESKGVTNFFTVFSVCFVLSMAVGGLSLMQRKYLIPLIPPQYGLAGVFRGATSSFFGYIGYDEICCIAGEAVNPRKNLPRAVILTLVIVATLYMAAAVALTGMQPYLEISTKSGFPCAFRWNHVEWAAQLAAAGEIFALPSVVLITVMAQPRLQYALARDGLLPRFFGEIDENGNLWNGALVSGTVMTLIATFVPFEYLNDLISSGILVAFTMTNWALISLRSDTLTLSPPHSYKLQYLLSIYNIVSFITGLVLTHTTNTVTGKVFSGFGCLTLIVVTGMISRHCNNESHKGSSDYFEIPFVPHLPCFGIFLNWYLIVQMDYIGILLLVVYLATAALLYFCYGAQNSVGRIQGWK